MDNKYSLKNFDKYGFSVLNPLINLEFIEDYAKEWIYKLLGEEASSNPTNLHLFLQNIDNYSEKLSQRNRHRSDNSFIRKILNSYILTDFLNEKLRKDWDIWDEGFGSLGIRIVRPFSNDGYLWSCKSWGPAKNVISFSLLVFANCQKSTTSVIPFSHKLKDLPTTKEDSIHCKDELRLDTKLFNTDNKTNPLTKSGEILVSHPNLIHTEKNFSEISTRISLEFRLKHG